MSTVEEDIDLFGEELDGNEQFQDSEAEGGSPRSPPSDNEKPQDDKKQRTESDDEVDALFDDVKKKKKKTLSKSSKGDEGKESKKKRPRQSTEKAPKSKKKDKEKRLGSNRFFLDEASEGEEDEEEYDETAEVREEELTKEHQEAAERVRRRHEEAANLFSKKSEEEIAREIEARAKADRKLDKHLTLEAARSARGKFIKPAALPDYNDPKLFKVRCKIGNEQIAIRSILLKSVALRKRDGFSRVKSAFCGNTPGYLYVEAFYETHVKEIVSGLQMIYISSVAPVPLKEMTHVLQVQSLRKPLSLFQFVRMRRGPNKGDLARIVDILNGGEKVVVQLVPRLEYHSEETKKQNKLLGVQNDSKVRPPPRLFDAEAARAVSLHGEIAREKFPSNPTLVCDVWNGDYFKDGFQLKEVKTEIWVNAQDVKPTLEELRLFQNSSFATQSNLFEERDTHGEDEERERDEDEDPEHAKAAAMDNALLQQIAQIEATSLVASPFVAGDFVKVTSGDLMNLVAQVISVDDKAQTAKIVALNQVFRGAIEVELALLVKHITEGVHIKVMSGQFAGQTGRVVSVSSAGKDAIAAILTDGSNANIQCNVSLLQVSDDVAIGAGSLAGYELYDLVQLSENETAVVVTVGAQKLKVVNHMGTVKDVAPQEIRFKLNSMRASAFDSANARVVCGDILHVHTGVNAKQSGTVKHINKGTVWLHSNQYPKNSGVFVVKGRNCSIAGAGGKSSSAPGFGSFGAMGGAMRSSSSGFGSTPLSQYSGRTPQGGAAGELRIGSQVKITGGAYRSMLGVVLNVEGNYVFVELSAKMKKVHVTKDQVRLAVRVEDDALRHRGEPSAAASYYGPMESFAGADTPHIASETPKWLGGVTPSHFGGSETPFISQDDNWNITERDHDVFALDPARQETPGATPLSVEGDRRIVTPLSVPATPTSVADNNNNEPQFLQNMVVKIKETGRLAVVMKYSPMDETVIVRLRDGTGMLAEDDMTLSTAGVSPMEPSKNARVKVISGAQAGKFGVVVSAAGRSCLVNIDGTNETFKQSHLVWFNS